MTVAEYREAHGLPRGLGLVCLGLHEHRSERGKAQVGTPGWQRLEAARDPLAASQARDLDAPSAPAVHAERAATAPSHLPSKRAASKSCPHCGSVYTGRGKTCGSGDCIRQQRSAATAAQQRARYRPLTQQEIEELQARLDTPEFWPLVETLIGDGVSAHTIAQTVGRSDAWLSTHRPR